MENVENGLYDIYFLIKHYGKNYIMYNKNTQKILCLH